MEDYLDEFQRLFRTTKENIEMIKSENQTLKQEIRHTTELNCQIKAEISNCGERISVLTMPSENERLSFYEIAKENSENFHKVFNKYESIDKFLHVETEYIPLYSTNLIESEKSALHVMYDIDGIVCELYKCSNIALPLSMLHLDLFRNTVPMFHKLKKHYKLWKFNNKWNAAIKQSKGLVISRSLGYEITIAIIPNKENLNYQNCQLGNKRAAESFGKIKNQLQFLLSTTETSDRKRRTLIKNPLNDVSFWEILPADQNFVLSVVDQAIFSTEPPDGWMFAIYLCKFGQKLQGKLHLSDVVGNNPLQSFSVHSAATISMKDMNLFWAREGLQNIVGNRGRLFPVMSLNESSNFQSNLDGRNLDITSNLKNVSTFCCDLTFVQLYTDLPHKRCEKWQNHSVSGTIVTTNLLHHNSTKRLHRGAAEYFKIMEDNASKIVGNTEIRLEIVNTFCNYLPQVISSKMFIDEDMLFAMLAKEAMIVPFCQDHLQSIEDVPDIFQRIALYLINELKRLYRSNADKGGFMATWYSLQLEFSLQKFFYGQLSCHQYNLLSINLGPGRDQNAIDRSLTAVRGILSLRPWNAAAMTENSCPPLGIWTKSQIEQKRIARCFDFIDLVREQNISVGAKFIEMLIADLKKDEISIPIILVALKAPTPCFNYRLQGKIGLFQLAEEIILTASRIKYPATSQRIYKLIRSDPECCDEIKDMVVTGLNEYKYFPKIQRYDDRGNFKFRWNNRDVLEILHPGLLASTEAKLAEINSSAFTLLEVKKICYGSTIKNLRKCPEIPWTKSIFKKMHGKKDVSDQNIIQVCALMTSLHLIKDGRYVDLKGFLTLCTDIGPPIMKNLLNWQILSSFTFQWLGKTIHREHPSISLKLTYIPEDRKKTLNTNLQFDQEAEQEEIEIQVEDVNYEQTINKQSSRHYSNKSKYTLWRNEEVEMLKIRNKSLTLREQHTNYIELCLKKGILHRSFCAFVKKIKSAGL